MEIFFQSFVAILIASSVGYFFLWLDKKGWVYPVMEYLHTLPEYKRVPLVCFQIALLGALFNTYVFIPEEPELAVKVKDWKPITSSGLQPTAYDERRQTNEILASRSNNTNNNDVNVSVDGGDAMSHANVNNGVGWTYAGDNTRTLTAAEQAVQDQINMLEQEQLVIKLQAENDRIRALAEAKVFEIRAAAGMDACE